MLELRQTIRQRSYLIAALPLVTIPATSLIERYVDLPLWVIWTVTILASFSLAWFLVKGLDKQISRGIQRLGGFITDAGQNSIMIDPNTLPFSEFEFLAEQANHMVAERSASGAELRAGQRRLRALIDALPDAVLVCNANGDILLVNGSASLFFGKIDIITSLDETGNNIADFLPHIKNHDLERCLSIRKAIALTERFIITRSDNPDIPTEVSLSPFELNGEGAVIVVIRDISERLAAEQAQQREHLAHAARVATMGEMASSIAHEVNQPLAAISNYAFAARNFHKRQRYDKSDEALLQISTQADRAAGVIRRIRDFIRKPSDERSAEDPTELVKDSIALAEIDAKRAQIGLTFEHDNDLAPVMVDPIQIQQVLINLIRNALEAQKSVGHSQPIKLAAQNTESGVSISVTDHGHGFTGDPEECFQAFQTSKEEGLGLGLAISRSLAESHGGTLTARNNPQGGAIFTLTLPAHEDADHE